MISHLQQLYYIENFIHMLYVFFKFCCTILFLFLKLLPWVIPVYFLQVWIYIVYLIWWEFPGSSFHIFHHRPSDYSTYNYYLFVNSLALLIKLNNVSIFYSKTVSISEIVCIGNSDLKWKMQSYWNVNCIIFPWVCIYTDVIDTAPIYHRLWHPYIYILREK